MNGRNKKLFVVLTGVAVVFVVVTIRHMVNETYQASTVPAETVFDVGDCRPSSIVRARCQVGGKQWPSTVKNAEVHPECSCVTASVETGAVASSKGVTLAVKVDTHGLHGKHEKRLVLQLRDPDYVAHVILRFNVVSSVECQPSKIDFGKIRAGMETTQSVVIKSLGEKSLVKAPIAATGSLNFRAMVEPIEPGKEYRVSLTAKPSLAKGPLQEVLALAVGDIEEPLVIVPIVGEVQ